MGKIKREMQLLKNRYIELNKEMNNIHAKIRVLKRECTHEIINQNDYAVCNECGEDFGWYCPDSPNHICEYEQEDGTYDEDSCRYCGQPEERK